MIEMMKGLCDWTQSKNGSMICGGLFLVGGLHMIFSEQQPVLGMFDLPSITFMGKDVGVQTVLGTRYGRLRWWMSYVFHR